MRAAREKAGYTQTTAAKAIHSNLSSMIRFEGGQLGLKQIEVFALMDLYGITDQAERERLDQLRAEGRLRGWWAPHRTALSDPYRTFIGLEDAADTRLDFTCLHMPGLLQTEAYARAVLDDSIPPLPAAVVDERVTVRMKRQEVITRVERPLRVHAVLDEGAVRRRVGGTEVWRGQLEHLLKLSTWPHITIQVLPLAAGAPASAAPVFVLLEFEEGLPDVAYLDLPTGGLFEEGEEAQPFRQLWDELRTKALAPSMSTAMIREIMQS